jgi:hypothetical protein
MALKQSPAGGERFLLHALRGNRRRSQKWLIVWMSAVGVEFHTLLRRDERPLG